MAARIRNSGSPMTKEQFEILKNRACTFEDLMEKSEKDISDGLDSK